MKNIYLIILILLVIVMPSCEDFLEENPPTFISKSNFFQTASDARTSMDGVYKPLLDGGGFSTYGRWWPAVDLATDDVLSRTGQNGFLAWFEHTISGSHNFFIAWGQYSNFWSGVSRANVVIDNIGDIDMDEAEKNAILGEAHAMRALYYFHLVRAYGDLPKVLSEITSTEGFAVPRSPVDEIYDEIIIPDLQFAEENCLDQLHDGRVTRWTAKVILADVYQTRAGWRRTSQGEFVQGNSENWVLARDKAQEIIDNSPHSLITESLVNGANIIPACGVAWADETQYTVESMMELGGADVDGFGSWLTRESYITTGTTGQRFWGPNNSSTPFVDEGDSSTIIEMKYPNVVNVGYYGPTPDLYRAFEAGDERRDWGILTRYTTPDGTNYVTQPSFQKYIDMGYALGEGTGNFRNTNNNFLMYRYADALLIYAESANEVSPSNAGDAAYEAINEIRNRAGLADLATGLSQDDFRRAVWQERRVELHAEIKRKWDLIRTNRLKTETDVIELEWEPSDNPPYMAEGYRNANASAGTVPYPDHEWLFPIPDTELTLVDDYGWEQNAGYLGVEE